jgi:NADPH2:quinone reductase
MDMVGGDYFSRNIGALAVEGRLVQIALQAGGKAEFEFFPVMMKRLTLTGSTLRPRTVEQKTAIAEALRQQVWPLLDTGRVKPIIDSTYALAEADQAHARMESSQHVGKIMLTV